jgi:hypothetical protein
MSLYRDIILSDKSCHMPLRLLCMMAVIAVMSAILVCHVLESMHFSSRYCRFLLAVFKEGARHVVFSAHRYRNAQWGLGFDFRRICPDEHCTKKSLNTSDLLENILCHQPKVWARIEGSHRGFRTNKPVVYLLVYGIYYIPQSTGLRVIYNENSNRMFMNCHLPC